MKIVIIGASGHGKVVLDILLSYIPSESIAGFADDNIVKGTVINNYKILGNIDSLLKTITSSSYQVALGIGDNNTRQKIYLKAKERGFSIATLIHAKSTLSSSAQIGEGSVVMAGAVVNAGVELGIGVIINTGATIDHDCKIGDWVHISPGANLAGGVTVGEGSHIGIGACAIGGIRIGNNCRIGAGGAVISDVEGGLTVAGVPARSLGDS